MDSISANRLDAISQKVRQILVSEAGVFALSVIDLASGQKWAHGSMPMRSASLIKIFIMVEAFGQINAGELGAIEMLSFAEEERVAGAGVLQDLPAGTARTGRTSAWIYRRHFPPEGRGSRPSAAEG